MSDPLIDGHGRPIGDVRISVTDRCNFRCQYCMPAEGLAWLPRSELLSFEEIERLVGLLARLGITDVRLTGGEPTVRAHLPVLVRKLAALPVDLSMTTNGATLALVADDLAVGDESVDIVARVSTTERTGVEMEALTAVSVAALTVVDMVKAVDRGAVIEQVQLESKDGGRRGPWRRVPVGERS